MLSKIRIVRLDVQLNTCNNPILVIQYKCHCSIILYDRHYATSVTHGTSRNLTEGITV